MSSSKVDSPPTDFAQTIRVTDERLVVELTDGREISLPLSWYPRLAHGRPEERAHWELIGQGDGIHWPDLDEDLSIAGILAGRRSGESQQSFERWLESRHSSGQ
jgi:hypothetical protein